MMGVLECANGQRCSLSSKEHEKACLCKIYTAGVTDTNRGNSFAGKQVFFNVWSFHFLKAALFFQHALKERRGDIKKATYFLPIMQISEVEW